MCGLEVARIPSCRSKRAYGAAILKAEGWGKNKEYEGFLMQKYKRIFLKKWLQ
jgi:hypothetical protein